MPSLCNWILTSANGPLFAVILTLPRRVWANICAKDVEGATNMKTRETIMDIAERISYSLSCVSATCPSIQARRKTMAENERLVSRVLSMQRLIEAKTEHAKRFQEWPNSIFPRVFLGV